MKIYDSLLGAERDMTEAEREMLKDVINGPSPEQIANERRMERQSLLTLSDWTQLSDVATIMTPEKLQEWKTYRQALRDIPLQTSFPNDVTWPTKPDS